MRMMMRPKRRRCGALRRSMIARIPAARRSGRNREKLKTKAAAVLSATRPERKMIRVGSLKGL
jgi:hypothetical protein